MSDDIFDLVVIGGGINGAGIAADASGRNLKVAIFEAKDFAAATSSASSKLIHGGLRYLEQYEFRLVREALEERETLLKKAPFIIWPMRFRLPHSPELRPVWLIRLGLFIYDYLGKRNFLAKSHYLRFDETSPLKPQFKEGFEYSDCWVDDARLVICNLVAAKENGALVRNQCALIKARRGSEYWQLELKDSQTEEIIHCRTKALVNAAGPWVQKILENSLQMVSPHQVRLVKGSHIIVKAPHSGAQAYILQNHDKRIVFAIPYLKQFLMIGTTDKDFHGSTDNVKIDPDEVDYLLNVYNLYFKHQLTKEDIVHSFSGVRPLYSDSENVSAQNVTRDYSIEINDENTVPLISVFGGKLTTYRKLSEAVVNKLQDYFPHIGRSWTALSPLPGGEGISSFAEIEYVLIHHYQLDAFIAHRLATSYGSRVWAWFSHKNDVQNDFGQGLGKKEVDYLIETEFVKTVEDLLWRRTKLGLFLTLQEQKNLQSYIQQRLAIP